MGGKSNLVTFVNAASYAAISFTSTGLREEVITYVVSSKLQPLFGHTQIIVSLPNMIHIYQKINILYKRYHSRSAQYTLRYNILY